MLTKLYKELAEGHLLTASSFKLGLSGWAAFRAHYSKTTHVAYINLKSNTVVHLVPSIR